MSEIHDPFLGLQLPAIPVAPEAGFAAVLRSGLADRLTEPQLQAPPADQHRPPPERVTTEVSDMSDPTPPSSITSASDPGQKDGLSPLTPYLTVTRAAAAISWYTEAFGALETTRFTDEDGRIGHAELAIGGARLMLADEYPEIDLLAPPQRGGTTVTLHLEVVDVDHTVDIALRTGATALREPSDQGHGSRNATLLDPFGHRWMLSQPIGAERTAAAAEATGAGGDGSAWTVSGRPAVEPGYYSLHVSDPARAVVFYGTVFDWSTEPGNVEGGNHVHNTRFPMGIGPLGEDARTDIVYFRVDDIEVYADRVEAAGGQVLSRQQYPSGGNAVCVDDQGHRFDLFQPAPGY